MHDLIGMITTRRRPRLLNTAAQHGARGYCRGALLRRLLATSDLPRHAEALIKLLEIEHDVDQNRRAHAPDYSARHHLELMIAILGEAKLLYAGPNPV